MSRLVMMRSGSTDSYDTTASPVKHLLVSPEEISVKRGKIDRASKFLPVRYLYTGVQSDL